MGFLTLFKFSAVKGLRASVTKMEYKVLFSMNFSFNLKYVRQHRVKV